jgi:hypothetical protein
MVLVTVCARFSPSAGDPDRRWLYRLLALVAAPALTLSVLQISTMPRRWLLDPTSASELAQVDHSIPAGAELVADQNVIGRMALGRIAFDYVKWGDRVPLRPGEVFVLFKRPVSAGRRQSAPATPCCSGAGRGSGLASGGRAGSAKGEVSDGRLMWSYRIKCGEIPGSVIPELVAGTRVSVAPPLT